MKVINAIANVTEVLSDSGFYGVEITRIGDTELFNVKSVSYGAINRNPIRMRRVDFETAYNKAVEAVSAYENEGKNEESETAVVAEESTAVLHDYHFESAGRIVIESNDYAYRIVLLKNKSGECYSMTEEDVNNATRKVICSKIGKARAISRAEGMVKVYEKAKKETISKSAEEYATYTCADGSIDIERKLTHEVVGVIEKVSDSTCCGFRMKLFGNESYHNSAEDAKANAFFIIGKRRENPDFQKNHFVSPTAFKLASNDGHAHAFVYENEGNDYYRVEMVYKSKSGVVYDKTITIATRCKKLNAYKRAESAIKAYDEEHPIVIEGFEELVDGLTVYEPSFPDCKAIYCENTDGTRRIGELFAYGSKYWSECGRFRVHFPYKYELEKDFKDFHSAKDYLIENCNRIYSRKD